MDWWTGGIAAVFLAGAYIFAPLLICWFSLRRYNPDEMPATLQKIVRRFEWRASARQCGSHAVLALILVLLAGAAWVFVQAKEITAQETGGDLQQKLTQRTDKRNSDIKEQNRLRDELTAATTPIIDMIGQEYQTGGDKSFQIDLLDVNGKIKTSGVLAQEIKNEFSTANSARIAIIVSGRRTSASGLVERYTILTTDRFVKPEGLPKLTDRQNLWEPKDLSSLVDQFDRVSHNVDIDAEALSRIAYDIKASEVAKAAGEEPSGPSGNLSLPFLVQLNITRFGTIRLASIAIGILVPLYRFSERLSAFYRARSDALRLHQPAGYKTVGIIRLSTMLTPTIDYGNRRICRII